jgi:hypothetical protein
VNDPYSAQAARPLLYSEWRRLNEGGTRANYNDYLRDMRMGSDPVTANIVDTSWPGPGLAEERRYTRGEVTAALNRASDLVQEPIDWEDHGTVLLDTGLNLAANATEYLLDHPGATLDEIIPACYSDVEIWKDEMDEGETVPEKGSKRWNELLTAKVKGWLA